MEKPLLCARKAATAVDANGKKQNFFEVLLASPLVKAS